MNRTIVAVYAMHWAGYADQVNREYPFDVTRGWVFGELIAEDDAKVVIAHQSFEDGDVRVVSVIPTGNILDRYQFTLEATQ